MTMRKMAIAMAAAALSVGLLGVAGPEAGAADVSRCDPDVYFELDANGFVTAYPGARCTGQDTFKSIEIKSIVSIENETTARPVCTPVVRGRSATRRAPTVSARR